MKRTVAIIGTGWVGSSIAISTLHSGVADELLLTDVRAEVAEGDAMDLAHGATFYPPAGVRAVTLEEAAAANVVVVTAGRGSRPDESRLALLRDNAAIIRNIARALAGCRGTVVVVSNPVDVLTHVLSTASGLSAERVLGTGTMLDTARLKYVLSRSLNVDARSVHAQVVGEHGDSEVVLWSSAVIGGVPVRRWRSWRREDESALATEVRHAAYEIIRRKGATNHAIGLVTADLLRSLLRDERRVLTVSRVQYGAAGVRDVALSLPAVVGADGAAEVLDPMMDDEERAALHHSADVLRSATSEVINA
jgi:L-lactate dehydrogenase